MPTNHNLYNLTARPISTIIILPHPIAGGLLSYIWPTNAQFCVHFPFGTHQHRRLLDEDLLE
jgi:hypothetical protein